MDAAIKHCDAGIGIWEWASNDRGGEPDVVMACAGDVPTLETLAAVDLLRQHVPDLKIRVVNVVDLMTLQPHEEHPHGLTDHDFDALFTTRQAGHLRLSRLSLADPPADLPAHQPRQHPRPRLQGGRHDDDALRHGRCSTISTASIWRRDVIDRVPKLGYIAAYAKQAIRDKLIEHKQYITPPRRRHAGGQAMALARGWRLRVSIYKILPISDRGKSSMASRIVVALFESEEIAGMPAIVSRPRMCQQRARLEGA